MIYKHFKEQITSALRARGITLTPQRLVIIDMLTRKGDHPSAGTLLKNARIKMPSISASTVYYTLALLKKEGLIKELEFYDMENRYDSYLADHIDLICRSCGSIENLDAVLPVSVESVKKATGFQAERMRYEYYGLCRKCRGKQR